MSLAARCPWCETVFRLTEGQVSAKGGMARCGVCNHTFNALDALLSDSAVAALERGAQAREANQEAAARANEQNASKPSEAIPIPLSIRKMFGGASTLAAAPPMSSPPSPATSTPPLHRTPLSGPPADKALTGSPLQVPTQTQTPAPTPIQAPAWTPPVVVVAAPAPVVKDPETRESAQAQDTEAAEDHVEPIEQPHTPAPPVPESAHVVAAAQPDAKDALPAPPMKAQQTTPASDIPIDYKVEMPNYDAERAAALAEAERQQKEQRDLQEQLAARASSADVAKELDAIKSALSANSKDEAANESVVDEARTDTSLNSLRLQHAAVQAASKAELLREQERMGPSTFQPSFLRSSGPSGRFARTRRFIGSVLLLMLFIGLLAQATYWWRSDIAMRVPQSRPYLVRACERLHCEVDPPAQIDQLSIESSELVGAPGNAGALSFTALVRNHSVNALAYPAIEITLTDARDQAILRRVFLPENYLGDTLGTRRLAGLPGNSEYTLKLTFNTSGVATSGYRAGIFYP